MFGKKTKVTLHAPCAGNLVPITEVPDPMFSQKMLGDGFAVIPPLETFEVVAPCAGTLFKVFDTGHAFAMKSTEGLEILVHIGLETVELAGKGFTPLAQTGDRVEAGTPVIRVEGVAVGEAGYNLITVLVLTRPAQVSKLGLTPAGAEVTLV